MKKDYIPFDWKAVNDKAFWLEPCEESYYYAEKWYKEALLLCEQLVEKTRSVRAKRLLEHIFMRLGELFDDNGNVSEAKKWYKKHNDLNEELAKETGTIPLPLGKNWLDKY